MRRSGYAKRPLCAVALVAGLAALTGCVQGGPAYDGGYDTYYGGYPSYGGYGGYYDPYRRQDTVFAPDPGIKCNRSVRICYDRNGANLALTDRYFGNKAADRLGTKLPPGEPDDIFEPKRTVSCNTSSRICTDDGQPSVKKTRVYFGKKAAKQIQNNP